MVKSWDPGGVVLGVALALAVAACGERPAEDEAVARDPEGVLGDVALADGGRVCETAQHGTLLVSGIVLAHADGNMHRVGECTQPVRPLFTHVQQVDRPAEDQELYVRVGDGRYLRVRPERGEPSVTGSPAGP